MRAAGLVIVLALAVPATHAKRPVTVSVCGATACASLDAPVRRHGPFGGGDVEAVRAASPSPFCRVVLGTGDERWTIFSPQV